MCVSSLFDSLERPICFVILIGAPATTSVNIKTNQPYKKTANVGNKRWACEPTSSVPKTALSGSKYTSLAAHKSCSANQIPNAQYFKCSSKHFNNLLVSWIIYKNIMGSRRFLMKNKAVLLNNFWILNLALTLLRYLALTLIC